MSQVRTIFFIATAVVAAVTMTMAWAYEQYEGTKVHQGSARRNKYPWEHDDDNAIPIKNYPRKTAGCAICHYAFDSDLRAANVFDCGHTACASCAAQLDECHLCRRKILEKKRMYLDEVDS